MISNKQLSLLHTTSILTIEYFYVGFFLWEWTMFYIHISILKLLHINSVTSLETRKATCSILLHNTNLHIYMLFCTPVHFSINFRLTIFWRYSKYWTIDNTVTLYTNVPLFFFPWICDIQLLRQHYNVHITFLLSLLLPFMLFTNRGNTK